MASTALSAYKAGQRSTRRKVGRRAKPSLSLAMLAGLAPTVAYAIEGYKLGGDQGGLMEAAHRVTLRMTGYEWKSGKFSFGDLMMGIGPLLLGGVAHKAANRIGVNRMLSRATMGFITI